MSNNVQNSYFKDMKKSKQAGSVNENMILLLKSKHITDSNMNKEKNRSTITLVDKDRKYKLNSMIDKFQSKIKNEKDFNQDKFMEAIKESSKIKKTAEKKKKQKEEKISKIQFKEVEQSIQEGEIPIRQFVEKEEIINKVTDLLEIENITEHKIEIDRQKWQTNPFKKFIQNYQNQLDPQQLQHILKSKMVKEGLALWQQDEIQQQSIADREQQTENMNGMNLININDLGIEARKAVWPKQQQQGNKACNFEIESDIDYMDMLNVASGKINWDQLHRMINQIEFEENDKIDPQKLAGFDNEKLIQTFRQLQMNEQELEANFNLSYQQGGLTTNMFNKEELTKQKNHGQIVNEQVISQDLFTNMDDVSKIYQEIQNFFEALSNTNSINQQSQKLKLQNLIFDEILKQLTNLFYLIVKDVNLKQFKIQINQNIYPQEYHDGIITRNFLKNENNFKTIYKFLIVNIELLNGQKYKTHNKSDMLLHFLKEYKQYLDIQEQFSMKSNKYLKKTKTYG